MSYELVGIIFLGMMGVIHMGVLVYFRRSFQEQLRRNVALEAQFQRWNAEKLDNLAQRLDQVIEMLRRREL